MIHHSQLVRYVLAATIALMAVPATLGRAETGPTAWGETGGQSVYYWQEGQWFTLPLAYMTQTVPNEEFEEAIVERDKFEEFLLKWQQNTGYAADGSYDPRLIKEGSYSGKLNLGFYVDSLNPYSRSYFYFPDMSPDGMATASIVIVWAGGSAPPAPEEYRQVFDRYYAELGPPKPLRSGHLAKIMSTPLPYEKRDRGYYIYEGFEDYEVRLSCSVEVAQPSCQGRARDLRNDAYIHVRFPEDVIWTDQSWISVAGPAFDFINSWRITD